MNIMEEILNEIIEKLDNDTRDLSREDYRALLEELKDDIRSRLAAMEEDIDEEN